MKTVLTYQKILLLLSVSLFLSNATISAQPPNDLIQNAIDIDQVTLPYAELNVDFNGATLAGDQTNSGACSLFLPGIWYKFTATNTAAVTAKAFGGGSPWIVFFTAPDENVVDAMELEYIDTPNNGCGVGNESSIFTEPGQTYYLYMRNSGFNKDILITGTGAFRPINDDIEDATNLNLGPSHTLLEQNIRFDIATNTNDQTTVNSGCLISQAGIWYKFTPTQEASVTAVVNNDDSAVVVFYTGPENASDADELTYVDQATNTCALDNSSQIDVSTGETYYIYMRNLSVSSVLISAANSFAIPENDLIVNATNVNGLTTYEDPNIHMLMATDTNDSGQSGGCDAGPKRAVWYKFTAETDGQVIAQSSGSNRSSITFYTAEDENAISGSELTYVDQNTNICLSGELSTINATAGTTYYLFAGVTSGSPYLSITLNLQGVLSTESNNLENFSYHPNPVKNTLHISASHAIDLVTISDTLGRLIMIKSIGATSHSLNLSSLQSGMYIMTVTSENKTKSFKILKQ